MGFISAFIWSFVTSVTNKKSREDKLGYCIALSLCNFVLICASGNEVGLSVNPLFYGIFIFLSPKHDFLANLLLLTVVPYFAGYFGFYFANTLIENAESEHIHADINGAIQLKMKKPKEVVFDV